MYELVWFFFIASQVRMGRDTLQQENVELRTQIDELSESTQQNTDDHLSHVSSITTQVCMGKDLQTLINNKNFKTRIETKTIIFLLDVLTHQTSSLN